MQAFYEQDEPCDCPVPCHHTVFDTSISYASTSNYDTAKLLKSKRSNALQKKFIDAREANQWVDESIMEEDKKYIKKLNENTISVYDLFTGITDTVDEMTRILDKQHDELDHRIWFHNKWGVKKVVYIMHHDFVRGWTVKDERTFSVVTPFYLEIIAQT